jgi:hypothetical protein
VKLLLQFHTIRCGASNPALALRNISTVTFVELWPKVELLYLEQLLFEHEL